tara:strand:+ start:82 stop:480 length:399 start_codon:yes stop_codon:yes gene_type:complete
MSNCEKETTTNFSKHIEVIVDEAKDLVGDAKDGIRSAYQTSGGSIKEAIDGALSSRDNVVMVRLNTDSLSRVDDLVDAGLLSSRSEAVAFLVGEGTKARADLFDKITSKVEAIRKVKEELQNLLGDTSEKFN